ARLDAAVRAAAGEEEILAARRAVRENAITIFNNRVDAAVTLLFLVLVAIIVAMSVREWVLLLARRKLATLRETEPVWLPNYAVAEANPLRFVSLLALAIGLLRELTGEAGFERERQMASCPHHLTESERQAEGGRWAASLED